MALKYGIMRLTRKQGNPVVKTYTVKELIVTLRKVAKDAPRGGETRVCVDDIERNLGANGPLEMLDVAYDNETDDVTIFCNEFEH